jgi:hypothetical protein
MDCTIVFYAMDHELYNSILPMAHDLYNGMCVGLGR